MPDFRVPDITRGLGRFTPKLWRRLFDMMQFVERYQGDIASIHQIRKRFDRPYIWVLLTGYTEVSANIFEYDWVEAVVDNSTGKWIEKDGGLSSDTTGIKARNGIETGNDGFLRESAGQNIEGASFTENSWFLQPIRGDDGASVFDPGSSGSWATNRAPAVPMFWERDDENELTAWFAVTNIDDGECGE